jgi:hypothetical protein
VRGTLDVCSTPVGLLARRGGRGATRFGILIGLLLLAGVAYAAAKYVPPYWTYLSLMDPVKEAAMQAARDEAKARVSLLAQANALGLDLEEDAVECTKDETSEIVRLTWSVPVDLPKYRHTLRFSIEKRSPLP